MCLVVLPLMQCEDKLAAGDQAQCGGSEGEDVIPEDQSDGEFFTEFSSLLTVLSMKTDKPDKPTCTPCPYHHPCQYCTLGTPGHTIFKFSKYDKHDYQLPDEPAQHQDDGQAPSNYQVPGNHGLSGAT
jgi:hypothetical protein